mmetsp:Transcript_60737/g.72123  ORF Transcript_60737/g.72123 Transcript_60737/m.72123 type:complete len:1115 (+) Transcript_60737:311-3655(+)
MNDNNNLRARLTFKDVELEKVEGEMFAHFAWLRSVVEEINDLTPDCFSAQEPRNDKPQKKSKGKGSGDAMDDGVVACGLDFVNQVKDVILTADAEGVKLCQTHINNVVQSVLMMSPCENDVDKQIYRSLSQTLSQPPAVSSNPSSQVHLSQALSCDALVDTSTPTNFTQAKNILKESIGKTKSAYQKLLTMALEKESLLILKESQVRQFSQDLQQKTDYEMALHDAQEGMNLLEKQVNSLTKQVHNLEEVKTRLIGELNSAQGELKNHEKELTQTLSERDALTEQVNASANELEQKTQHLVDSLDALEKEKTIIYDNWKHSQEALQKSDDRVKQLVESNRIAEAEKAALRETLKLAGQAVQESDKNVTYTLGSRPKAESTDCAAAAGADGEYDSDGVHIGAKEGMPNRGSEPDSLSALIETIVKHDDMKLELDEYQKQIDTQANIINNTYTAKMELERQLVEAKLEIANLQSQLNNTTNSDDDNSTEGSTAANEDMKDLPATISLTSGGGSKAYSAHTHLDKQLKAAKRKIMKLEKKLAEKDTVLNESETRLTQCCNDMKNIGNYAMNLEQALKKAQQEKDDCMIKWKNDSKTLKKSLAAKEEEVEDLLLKDTRMKEIMDKLKDKLGERTLELEDSQKCIAVMNVELNEAKEDSLVDSGIEEKRELTNDNDNTDNATAAEMEHLKGTVATMEAKLTILEDEISIKEEQMLALQQELSTNHDNQDKLIKNHQSLIQKLQNELEATKTLYRDIIAKLEDSVTRKEAQVSELQFLIKSHVNKITILEERVQELVMNATDTVATADTMSNSSGSHTDDDDDSSDDDDHNDDDNDDHIGDIDDASQDKDTELAQELHLAKSKIEALSDELQCTQANLKVALKEKDQLPDDLLLLEETPLEGDADVAATEDEITRLCDLLKVTQHENDILMQELDELKMAAIEERVNKSLASSTAAVKKLRQGISTETILEVMEEEDAEEDVYKVEQNCVIDEDEESTTPRNSEITARETDNEILESIAEEEEGAIVHSKEQEDKTSMHEHQHDEMETETSLPQENMSSKTHESNNGNDQPEDNIKERRDSQRQEQEHEKDQHNDIADTKTEHVNTCKKNDETATRTNET